MAKEKHLTWLVSIYVSDFKVSLVCLFWNNEIIHNFKAPKFAILNILVFCFLKNTFVHQLSNPFFMSRQSPNIQHGINKSPSQSFSIHKALHWMEWQIAAATPLLSTAVTPSPIPPQRNNNVPAFKIQTKWGLLRTYTYANTRTHTHTGLTLPVVGMRTIMETQKANDSTSPDSMAGVSSTHCRKARWNLW